MLISVDQMKEFRSPCDGRLAHKAQNIDIFLHAQVFNGSDLD